MQCLQLNTSYSLEVSHSGTCFEMEVQRDTPVSVTLVLQNILVDHVYLDIQSDLQQCKRNLFRELSF